MTPAGADRRLEEAIRHFAPPPGTQLWHGGATVPGALRGVTAEEAAWRPDPERHSIWALVLHIAYWNYAVRRRLVGAERGGFPRSPSNWPDVPDPASDTAWTADRRLLREQRDALSEALCEFDPRRLDEYAGGTGKTTFADLVTGIVLHDVYHVGQIQLMKRLVRTPGRVAS